MVPLLRGDLGDRSPRVQARAEQQSPAAGQHSIRPGEGPAVGRAQQAPQPPLPWPGLQDGPRSYRQPGGVDPGRRDEGRRADRPGEPHLVTGGPPGGLGIARPRAREPPGGPPADDKLGTREPDRRIAKQAPAQRGRQRERRAGHDQELPPRQRHRPQVRLDHADAGIAVETPPPPRGQARVPLHGDHAGPGDGQPSGDRAIAGAEIEEQPAVASAAGASKLGDQRAVTQEVSTGRIRRRRRPPCRGRPWPSTGPFSSSRSRRGTRYATACRRATGYSAEVGPGPVPAVVLSAGFTG
jgi:hypothetical protein